MEAEIEFEIVEPWDLRTYAVEFEFGRQVFVVAPAGTGAAVLTMISHPMTPAGLARRVVVGQWRRESHAARRLGQRAARAAPPSAMIHLF